MVVAGEVADMMTMMMSSFPDVDEELIQVGFFLSPEVLAVVDLVAEVLAEDLAVSVGAEVSAVAAPREVGKMQWGSD